MPLCKVCNASAKFWEIKSFQIHAHYCNVITHSQLMRLSKLEPEPLLQLDLDLLGNVANKCLGDLWQFDHRLHQQDHGATQTQLPKLYGR